MNIKVLKLAAKRLETGNFSLLALQVIDWKPQEEFALLGRKGWGIYSDSPWLRFELQSEVAVNLSIDGISFAATMQRAKLARPSIEGHPKITLLLQKDICEADMHLSALVGSRDEDGQPISYFCAVSGEQIQAELEGVE